MVTGAPLGETAAAAILVHGRNQGPETMLGLVERLALPDVHYVLPVAADGTWYPQRFTEPTAANEPRLTQALAALGAAVARLEAAGRPAETLALVGFSQGACLTLEWVARNPRRYGSVAGLTGGLIGADSELTRPGAGLDGTPLLITTSEQDEWVPAERTRATAAILATAGAEVDLRVFPGAEHTMKDDEVDAVRRLIQGEGNQ